MTKTSNLELTENLITNHFLIWLAKETGENYSEVINHDSEGDIIDTEATNVTTDTKLSFQITVSDGRTIENGISNTNVIESGVGEVKWIDSEPLNWIMEELEKKGKHYAPSDQERTILLIKAPTTFHRYIRNTKFSCQHSISWKGVYIVYLPTESSHPDEISKNGYVLPIRKHF